MKQLLVMFVLCAAAVPGTQAQGQTPNATSAGIRGQTLNASQDVAIQLLTGVRQPPGATQGVRAELTLDEAIAQGLANSHRLAELKARAEAADFAVEGRHDAYLPVVSLQGGYLRTNHVEEFSVIAPGPSRQVVYPDIPDNYRTRLDLQWPIYTGGRTDALIRAADAERTAVGKDLDAARADLRLEITRAFYAVLTARDTEDVLRRSLDAADAHLRDVRSRLASGLIPPNDVSSAEAQVSHERVLAVEASTLRGVAEADLQRLIGAPPGPLSLVDPKRADTPQFSNVTDAGAVSELIARALQSRPERQALEQRAVSADMRASATASSKWPQVGIGGGFDYANPQPRNFPRNDIWATAWDASINVTWTLWDGGRRGAETGEARANAAALRTRVGNFDREVTFEVRARALELGSSRQAVTAADDEVRAALEAERVVTERYRAGVATPTDVLDAQVARLQAELDRTRALANVRLAEARLERAIGQ
jgi:outer membrane protein